MLYFDRDIRAEKLQLILDSPEIAEKMGESGFMMSKQCYVDNALKQLQQVFEETVATYSGGISCELTKQ